MEFDTITKTWKYLIPENSPVAVTGHSATLVEGKMIVIFGLSDNGMFSGVQEYDIGKINTFGILEKSIEFAHLQMRQLVFLVTIS